MNLLAKTDSEARPFVKVRGCFICAVSGEKETFGPRSAGRMQGVSQQSQTKSAMSKLRDHSQVKQFPHSLIAMIGTQHNTDVLVPLMIELPGPGFGTRYQLMSSQAVLCGAASLQLHAVLAANVGLLDDGGETGCIGRGVFQARAGSRPGGHRDVVEIVLPANELREWFIASLLEQALSGVVVDCGQTLREPRTRFADPLATGHSKFKRQGRRSDW